MTAVATSAEYVTLRAWSRAWWAEWHGRIARDLPTRSMEQTARHGQPWRISDAAPFDRHLVEVRVLSPGFAAWAAYHGRQGRRLPRPRFAPVVYLPAPMPPQAAP